MPVNPLMLCSVLLCMQLKVQQWFTFQYMIKCIPLGFNKPYPQLPFSEASSEALRSSRVLFWLSHVNHRCRHQHTNSSFTSVVVCTPRPMHPTVSLVVTYYTPLGLTNQTNALGLSHEKSHASPMKNVNIEDHMYFVLSNKSMFIFSEVKYAILYAVKILIR